MSDTPLDSAATCIVCENAFTPDELDRIEQHGDGLTHNKAVLAGGGWSEAGANPDRVRVTRTAAIRAVPEVKWLYDRIFNLLRTVNSQAFQFDLAGFSEPFQYTVYYGMDGGHYDWHVDASLQKTQRKLSLSLQLSDPAGYEGGDLQFHGNQQIETAPRNRGAVIVFPSYILHRVSPVTAGTRKSLVVWVYGPKFK